MNRFAKLGLTFLFGALLGCSGGVPDNQPKNANPNAPGRVQRDANSPTNQPKATTTPNMKE